MTSTRMGHMLLSDYTLKVPLDKDNPERGEIDLFFREVTHVSQKDANLPLLIFLQGGPGGASPRVSRWGIGWLNEALKHYRVILPDQRGTGRSSRITSNTMQAFSSAEDAASYLSLFDARAIIDDFEYIRCHHYGGQQWATLGQSYGGFLTLSYLSFAPQALLKCHVTGGLPSIDPSADEVYRRTYPRVEKKLKDYVEQFPGDEKILNDLADYLQQHEVHLPNGDLFMVRRLQMLGMMLGMQTLSDQLHWLLEEAFTDDSHTQLNPHFLNEIQQATGMDANPLYAALQENIYANSDSETRWSAQRLRNERPQFAENARPLRLTGEMVYPWMFDDVRELKPFKAGVTALAHRTARKPLYDKQQLAQNEVPIAAIIYEDDLYVDRELSLQTAEAIPNLHYWITNEYEHDGVRVDDRVFRRLYEMLEGR